MEEKRQVTKTEKRKKRKKQTAKCGPPKPQKDFLTQWKLTRATLRRERGKKLQVDLKKNNGGREKEKTNKTKKRRSFDVKKNQWATDIRSACPASREK